ncbi:MAG: L-1-amino-2-propanol dehydrogenase [NADP+], partial [uncultured Nocardioidaceae bacterium]
VHIGGRQDGGRHRRQQGHRQGHRGGLRPRRRRRPARRPDRGAAAGRGGGARPAGRRPGGDGGDRRRDGGRLPAPGRHRGGALRWHRRAVRQRRGVPRGAARRHDRGRPRRGPRVQRQGHGLLGAGLPPGAGGERAGPCRADLVDHRADDRLPGLVALRRQQGSAAGLPAHGRDRARPAPHHDQRGAPGQRHERGPGRDGRGVHRRHGGRHPAAPARHRRRHRARRAVPGQRRGRLHHRPDARRRRRPGAPRVGGGARGHLDM